MTDNANPGELMPDEILDQLEHAFSMTGRLDGVMLKLTEEQYEYIKNLVRAKQSPPVQSDAELQGAIAWMREKHKAGELPHGATWYLNKIIDAAERRVAGQAGVDALKAVEEIQNYIDLKDEIDGNPYYRLCDLLKLIKSALTAQKGE